MDLNPINQLDLVTMAAIVVIFTVTYVGLRRFFVLPLLAVIREREVMVEAARADQDEAAQVLESANGDAESVLTKAREEADAMLTQAREESLEQKREQVAAATREASGRLEAGRTEIAEGRQKAMKLMRGQAVECVGIACGQLLGSVDDRAIGEAVDKLMTRYAH